MQPKQFKALGHTVKVAPGETPELEPVTLAHPALNQDVQFVSDEVTAICPVTGQPDWYTITISIYTNKHSIESKSLKLYLQSFHDKGNFAEDFATIILSAVVKCTNPRGCRVTVVQKSRGGITLTATAGYHD